MKKSKVKKIPKFKDEDEEREFWDTHDLTDYFDFYKEVHLDLSKLKPTTETISLRLPGFMLHNIKQLANARDVPYQSLMKIFLARQLEEELKRKNV